MVPTDILLEVYSPLGNPGRPGKTDTDPVVLEDTVIKEIATKHNCTPAQVPACCLATGLEKDSVVDVDYLIFPFSSTAQVCISFALHRGLPVIPKSVTPSRIAENFKATELKLDAEDMRRLREIKTNFRALNGRIFYQPDDTLETFWDMEEDEKFVVTQPEAKKQRREEE